MGIRTFESVYRLTRRFAIGIQIALSLFFANKYTMSHTSSNISKATVAAVNAGTKADAKPRKSGRILAIDVMRGITVAGMILVNNSGGPGTYTPLEHSSWNGLTPTDLVFPFFMFIMGISTFISLRKFDFRLSAPLAWKILKRTVLIFAIGMGLAWLSLFAKGLIVEGKTLWEATMHFGDIRILGVLPRLAICYGIGSLLAVTLRHRWLPIVIVATLVLYGIMLLVANGYAPDETNILSIADRAVLTDAHMYYTKVDGVRIPIDPEGVLSTIPSIMHVMIGFWCGRLIMEIRDNRDRALRLLLVGFVLTLCGWLLSYGLPINKKVWSPTFVLTTCGMASALLGFLVWAIDIRGMHGRWTRFFEVFGVNPLFLYALAWVVAIFMGLKCFPDAAAPDGVYSAKSWIYYCVLLPLTGNASLSACLYAIAFVLFNWLCGLPLYRKKIYIKI